MHSHTPTTCRLVSEEILQLISPSACMIYVGKEQGFHTRTQTEIHELLCQFAQSCSTVVRLKGGDPYIFGRGGEEMEYLQQRGIAVHCVPGLPLLECTARHIWHATGHCCAALKLRILTHSIALLTPCLGAQASQPPQASVRS